MRKLFLTGAMALAIAASAVQAQAATVATFADPTVGMPGQPPPFLFTYTASGADAGFAGGTLTGGYTGSNLTLELLGASYNGATFTFPTLTANGTTSLGGINLFPAGGLGTITFFDAASNPLLLVDFDSATLNQLNTGASDLALNIVDIRPPSGTDVYLDPEVFSFAFANQSQGILQAEINASAGVGSTVVNTTASFTSSATVVPEPGTMTLFGSGLVGLASALRRRYGKKQA